MNPSTHFGFKYTHNHIKIQTQSIHSLTRHTDLEFITDLDKKTGRDEF